MARELTESSAPAQSSTGPRVRWRSLSAQQRLLLALCLLAALRGIVYILIIPPWEHHDEPTHFEYAALIARSGELPARDAVDRELRFAIARSMQNHASWGPRDVPPEDDGGRLPYIGVPQTSHLPLYYILASLPVRLSGGAPVEMQLYSVRLFSLLLGLLTLVLAALVLRLVLPAAPELRLAALAMLVLSPTYGAQMAAASSDVLMNLVGLLLLLLSLLVVRAGWNWRSLLLTVAGLALPFVTKRTIFVLAVLPLLALLLAAPALLRRWVWCGLALLLAAGLALLLLGPRASAYWVAADGGQLWQAIATPAYNGQQALLVENGAAVEQRLTGQAVYTLQGQQASSGVWARAAQGQVQVLPPELIGAQAASPPQPLLLDEQWRFIGAVASVRASANQLTLRLSPPVGSGAVLYDSAVVARSGAAADGSVPLLSPGGEITWNDKQVVNLLRNPSIEAQVVLPLLPDSLSQRVDQALPDGSLGLVISSIADWQFIKTVYPELLLWVFRSYWLGVARQVQVDPLGVWLPLLTLLACLGALGLLRLWLGHVRSWLVEGTQKPETRSLMQRGGSWLLARGTRWQPAGVDREAKVPLASGRTLLLCTVATSIAWATLFLRVHIPHLVPSPLVYYPPGRYAFGGFVPAMLLLVVGLAALLPRRWHGSLCVALTVLWTLLDASGILGVIWTHYVTLW